MSLETREIKLFGRDIPGFCRDIPEEPEKFEKKNVWVQFSSPTPSHFIADTDADETYFRIQFFVADADTAVLCSLKWAAEQLSGPVLRELPRDYLSDTPLACATMGFLMSQHGQLGAIPPPPFLSISPWRACKVDVRYPPLKRGISAILARYPMKTRQMGAIPPSAILSRKGIARYGGVSRTGPIIRESETTIKIKFALFRWGWAGGQGGKWSKTLFFMGNATTIKF